ncbi:MAG TPA: hypothetical protein VMH04_24510 [Candidatus Solibacter sp.]|nr:hypothetical protein [Candidatus Solibacter sp.]
MIAPVLPRLQSRFDIGVAEAADDAEIRELLRRSPIPGQISVTFEREPNFLESCRIRGDFVQVGIGRDRRTGKLVGLGTRSIAPAFINGQPAPLGYLSDLRVDGPYRGGTLLARGYQFLRRLHEDGCAQLYTTVIFNDNHAALATITSGRAGLPKYHDMGRIHCPGINIRSARPAIRAECEIHRGSKGLLPEMLQCIHRNNAHRQFAPLHTPGMFQDRWRDFRLDNFHVALRGDKVVGVLGSWDQRSFKQTRIVSYGSRLRWLVPLANALRPIAKTAAYPKPGGEVPYFYISFIAIDEDDVEVFRALLRSAYNAAVGKGYLYAMLALHERDPLLPALREYSLTPFFGRLFCVTFEDGEQAFSQLDGRVPYLEAATF